MSAGNSRRTRASERGAGLGDLVEAERARGRLQAGRRGRRGNVGGRDNRRNRRLRNVGGTDGGPRRREGRDRGDNGRRGRVGEVRRQSGRAKRNRRARHGGGRLLEEGVCEPGDHVRIDERRRVMSQILDRNGTGVERQIGRRGSGRLRGRHEGGFLSCSSGRRRAVAGSVRQFPLGALRRACRHTRDICSRRRPRARRVRHASAQRRNNRER